MARASYVYVVFYGPVLVAVFTVKHECATFLERKWPTTVPSNLKIIRAPDGREDLGVDITTDFFED